MVSSPAVAYNISVDISRPGVNTVFDGYYRLFTVYLWQSMAVVCPV